MSTTLRYNEYYDTQASFDWLYERSKANALNGIGLYEYIISRENILLAYRTIKSNTGSKTKGCDGLTIKDYKIIDEDEFVNGIRNCLMNYRPRKVRRVFIPKDNGKLRPLGIPSMRDRLIQQMFKQVLEPIVEAKFHKHSYGFRQNRSTKHAIARCAHLVNHAHLNYVVDVDINKGFFDNVNHRKLINQLWNIGVKDKRVLTIINRMLKAEIEGEGIPTKGTPAGGILSPLLANVVLNEFDWWISNQWETFKSDFTYSKDSHRLRALHKTNMKQMVIVRYADDFKIFTNNHRNAQKIYHAVKAYLFETLHLEISPDKSKITNLRKRSSEFLGFELRAVKKSNKYVMHSHVAKGVKERIVKRGREAIKEIQKSPSPKTARYYNAWVLGLHNYFQYATHVNIDFVEIAYRLSKSLYNRLKSIGKYKIPIKPSPTYQKFYKGYKTFNICGVDLFPIRGIKTSHARNFSQEICNYTENGRGKIHRGLAHLGTSEISKLMYAQIPNKSVEYIDNRISKYSAQQGKCAITGKFLFYHQVYCHHITPTSLGGDDSYNNLVVIGENVHRLIHATDKKVISYLKRGLIDSEIEKINKYRVQCKLTII